MNAYILSPDNAMVCQLSYTGEGACQDIFNKPITLLNYCIEILKFENSDSTLETRPWQGYLIAYNENILWLQFYTWVFLLFPDELLQEENSGGQEGGHDGLSGDQGPALSTSTGGSWVGQGYRGHTDNGSRPAKSAAGRTA